MQAQGNLGTSVRGQAYGEAERRAQAADEARRIIEACLAVVGALDAKAAA
jgi:hypothetical protein